MTRKLRILVLSALVLLPLACGDKAPPPAEKPGPVTPEPAAKAEAAPVAPKPEAKAEPAEPAGPEAVGQLSKVMGTVERAAAGTDDFAACATGAELYPGDRLRTGEGSWAEVALHVGGTLRIGEDSTFSVSYTSKKGSPKVLLTMGRMWAKLEKVFQDESSFEVRTTNAVAGVRGTTFRTWAGVDGTTMISVVEGKVEVRAKGKKVMVAPEQATTVALAKPPVKPRKEKVDDKVYKKFAVGCEKNLVKHAAKIANLLALELASTSTAVEQGAETAGTAAPKSAGEAGAAGGGAEAKAAPTGAELEQVRRLEQEVAALEAQLQFLDNLNARAATGKIKNKKISKRVGVALKRKVDLARPEVKKATSVLQTGSKTLLKVRPVLLKKLGTPVKATDAEPAAVVPGTKVAAVAPAAMKKLQVAGRKTVHAAPVGARPVGIAGAGPQPAATAGTAEAKTAAPAAAQPLAVAGGTKTVAVKRAPGAVAQVDLPPAEGKKPIPLPKLVKSWKSVTELCDAFDKLEKRAATIASKNPYEFPPADKKRHMLHFAKQVKIMGDALKRLAAKAASQLKTAGTPEKARVLMGEKARAHTYTKRIAQRIKALRRQATTYNED